MPEAPAPLLSVRDLKVHFKVRDRKAWPWTPAASLKAVDGVSFDLRAGETLGIVGESGCGKSTLARACLNLIPATGGEVVWQGKTLRRDDHAAWLAARRDIQIIFQDPLASLNPRMTVARIIGEPLRIHRPELGDAQVNERVAAVMAEVGLTPQQSIRVDRQLHAQDRRDHRQQQEVPVAVCQDRGDRACGVHAEGRQRRRERDDHQDHESVDQPGPAVPGRMVRRDEHHQHHPAGDRRLGDEGDAFAGHAGPDRDARGGDRREFRTHHRAGDRHAGGAAGELRDEVEQQVPPADLAQPEEGERYRRVEMRAGTPAPGRVDQRRRQRTHRQSIQETTHGRIGERVAQHAAGRLDQGGGDAGKHHEQRQEQRLDQVFGPMARQGVAQWQVGFARIHPGVETRFRTTVVQLAARGGHAAGDRGEGRGRMHAARGQATVPRSTAVSSAWPCDLRQAAELYILTVCLFDRRSRSRHSRS